MNKIYFVIGASGSGKTTVTQALHETGSSNFKTVYFDDIKIPSLEEIYAKYKSPEEWQKAKTIEWVKTIKDTFLPHAHVILDGQTRPAFIEEACIKNEIVNYDTVLFDCSEEQRTQRLIARGQSELANAQMMNWATYLRQESQKRAYHIIDTTDQTIEKTLHVFQNWLKSKQ